MKHLLTREPIRVFHDGSKIIEMFGFPKTKKDVETCCKSFNCKPEEIKVSIYKWLEKNGLTWEK